MPAVLFTKKAPEAIRSRVTLDEINGLEITIPAARRRFTTAFLGVWLVGWAIGEVAVTGSLIAMACGVPIGNGPGKGNPPPAVFLPIWLAMWTIGGVAVTEVFIWQLRGRELIRIDPDGMSLFISRAGTLIPRRTRVYPMSEVRNLRFAPPNLFLGFPASFSDMVQQQAQWIGSIGGNLVFDHDGREVRFGSMLSETESRRLIRTIRDHYKIEDDQEESLPIERL